MRILPHSRMLHENRAFVTVALDRKRADEPAGSGIRLMRLARNAPNRPTPQMTATARGSNVSGISAYGTELRV
jgi:hypothetical protein